MHKKQQEEHPRKNRSYGEELDHILEQQDDKKKPGLMPLPENHWGLLQMMATYAARLWTLYGPKCNHYKKVFHIHQLLEDPVVETNRNNFTPILCRRITWEIIDDSCQFFSSPLHSSDFANGKMPKFKSSLLDYVIPQVRF